VPSVSTSIKRNRRRSEEAATCRTRDAKLFGEVVEDAVGRLCELRITTHVIHAPGEIARIASADRIHGGTRVSTECESHRTRRFKRDARARRNLWINATAHRSSRSSHTWHVHFGGPPSRPLRLRSPVDAGWFTCPRIELWRLRELHASRHGRLWSMATARGRRRRRILRDPRLSEQRLHGGIDQCHLARRLARPSSVVGEVVRVMRAGEAAPRRSNLLGGRTWRQAEHFVRAPRPPPHVELTATHIRN